MRVLDNDGRLRLCCTILKPNRYRQIGNAVPPPLVAAVASRVVMALTPAGCGAPVDHSVDHSRVLLDTLLAASPDPGALKSTWRDHQRSGKRALADTDADADAAGSSKASKTCRNA